MRGERILGSANPAGRLVYFLAQQKIQLGGVMLDMTWLIEHLFEKGHFDTLAPSRCSIVFFQRCDRLLAIGPATFQIIF